MSVEGPHGLSAKRLLPLLLLALLASCATDRAAAPPLRVMITDVSCTDKAIGEAVRLGLMDNLLRRSDHRYIVMVEKPEEHPDLTITAVVTFGQATKAGNSETFISSVACTVRRTDGTLYDVSTFGQRPGDESKFFPPNACGLYALDAFNETAYARQRAR